MARVSAPFFSAEASGSVDKTLTASSCKGQAYMKGFSIPSNPQTEAQQAHRAKMAAATLAWQNLYEKFDEHLGLNYYHFKEFYNIIAVMQGKGQSGFNLFCWAYIWLLQWGITLPDMEWRE